MNDKQWSDDLSDPSLNYWVIYPKIPVVRKHEPES